MSNLDRLESEAELAIAKQDMRRREESLAAAQRQRQREMNVRLLGQFAAIVAFGAIVAYVYFF
jgi:hypothetical protein